MKKIISIVLSIAMVMCCMSFTAFAAQTSETLVIDTDCVLEDVSIIAAEGPAIEVAPGVDVTITVSGENYVKGATGFAGIYVPEDSTLTIAGDGILTAVGGDAAEIESDDNTRYNLKYRYSAGAGIGGNGSYFMSDRSFSSKWSDEEKEMIYTDITGNQYLIVSNANFGTININMGEQGQIVATGGNAAANQGGGSGIGSGGANPWAYTDIELLKETGEKEYYDFKGEVVIASGNVTATGGTSENSMSSNAGAGIGAGCSSQAIIGNNIDITITGGTVIATGAMDAAAIGGGAHVEGGDITITGGNITAVSGVETTQSGNGAGIGAGHMAYDGIIAIKGDAVVSAKANGNAAGIGAGADTYVNNEDDSTDELHCDNVIFGGTADISFDGGKTTFFTIEENSNPTLTSESAVCAVVNNNGVTIGLTSSFEEAVSVINEFSNVTTLRLIKDTTVDETVVIEDDIIIDGNGYTLKGADITDTNSMQTAVTPLAVEGAEVILKNITVKGGNAYNNDIYQPTASYGIAGDAIEANGATLIIDNSTIAGGDSGAEYTMSAGSSIVAADSDIVVTDSTLATGRLMRENVIGAANIYLDTESTIDLTDVVLDTAYSTYASDNVIATMHENGQDTDNYTGEVALDGEIKVLGTKLDNVTIVPGDNLTFKGNIDASYISDTLTIKYVKKDVANGVDTDEQADLYDIIIEGDDQFINRLTSVDLTFSLESDTSVKPVYEIIPVAPVNVTTDSTYANRYMFSFDGVTQPDETAQSVVIAQVKFSGYGAYTFAVDADATTNIANATKTNDSIVEHFIPGGDTTKGEGALVIDENVSAEIVVPVRDLTIVVDFPNAVEKNVAEYQDMTVTIAGGDLTEAIVVNLGNEDVTTAVATEYEKRDAKYTVDTSIDNKYTVSVTDVLTVNTAYNVTVKGAGYRTARYTVTMTDNKELTFWNNVMDDAKVVETAKASSAVVKNFLAGDIVADNNINVYDLSAVVSYFATTNTASEYSDYAKYDLNRDGVIDSKDVAYVLVSWNN